MCMYHLPAGGGGGGGAPPEGAAGGPGGAGGGGGPDGATHVQKTQVNNHILIHSLEIGLKMHA